MNEQREYEEGEWEQLDRLDLPQPVRGKVTVLEGRTESSINGREAIFFAFEGVGNRATFMFGNSQKQPMVNALEKGQDGSYKLYVSEGVWLFEPEK